jgi:glycerol-3-phosphate acyltransferase PlsY
MIETLILLSVALIGYIFGSIPTAVIIGKVFFKKDVREYGSKNAGGSNAGRVLGRKVGVIVIAIDMIKTIIPLYLSYFIIKYTALNNYNVIEYVIPISGFSCLLGHCFPLFAEFKGGKAVSSYAAIILSTNWLLTIIGILIFFITLKIKKYVSLSSILCGLIIPIITFILVLLKANFTMIVDDCSYLYAILILLSGIVLIVRHGPNIKRLLKHEENKISWLK